MGRFLSRRFGNGTHLVSFVGFFVRSHSRFFVPIRALFTAACAGAVKVGRRANPFHMLRPRQATP
jgi:hypothetical protein